MRAILRASDKTSHLWIESGERFELPELTDPATIAARAAAARGATKPGPAARRVEPTGPTDEGGPGAAARVTTGKVPRDDLEDLATDEMSRGALARLRRPSRVLAVANTAPDSLPPLGALELGRERSSPAARVASGTSRQPFAKIDDEMSTGLFEPMAWDEADPCSAVPVSESAPEPSSPREAPRSAPAKVVAKASAPVKTPPKAAPVKVAPAKVPQPMRAEDAPARLSLVRSAAVEEDFSGIVATPLPSPPRPQGPASAPPPMRATAELPDWYDDESNGTFVVLDPTRPRFRWTLWTCVAADLAAWAAGFAVTFAAATATAVAAIGVAVVAA
jgi:hypothetical protein